MKSKRMSYKTASTIFLTSFYDVKGIKGFLWLAAVILFVLGLFTSISQIQTIPAWLSYILMFGMALITAYISIGVIFISKEWKEEKKKDFDHLFIFLYDKDRVFKFFLFAALLAVISVLSFIFIPEKGSNNLDLVSSLKIILAWVVTIIASKIVLFASILRCFDSLSLSQSFKKAAIGFLKNIDTLIVFLFVLIIFTIFFVLVSLGIMLIFVVPMVLFTDYILFRAIFPLPEQIHHPQ